MSFPNCLNENILSNDDFNKKVTTLNLTKNCAKNSHKTCWFYGFTITITKDTIFKNISRTMPPDSSL